MLAAPTSPAAVSKLIPLLRCRTLADFQTAGVSEEIAAMRLQYYEDKRKVFTKQVEETIRSGIIEDVKAEFPAPSSQQQQMGMTAKPTGPPVRHRTVGSETRAMNSSFTMMTRHAKNFL